MTEAQSFLAEIEAFLVRTGMAPSTFGRRVANDNKFVVWLRSGGQVTLDRAARVRGLMAEIESGPRLVVKVPAGVTNRRVA